MAARIILMGVIPMLVVIAICELLPEREAAGAMEEIVITRERGCEEIVREVAPIYGFDPALILAQVEQESSGCKNNFRFEPHLLAKTQKMTRDGEEALWLASSHGPLHVLGLTAKKMGLSREDMRDRYTAIEAGIRWLAKCVENQRDENPNLKDRKKLIELALIEYNGSRKYPSDVYRHLPKVVAGNLSHWN